MHPENIDQEFREKIVDGLSSLKERQHQVDLRTNEIKDLVGRLVDIQQGLQLLLTQFDERIKTIETYITAKESKKFWPQDMSGWLKLTTAATVVIALLLGGIGLYLKQDMESIATEKAIAISQEVSKEIKVEFQNHLVKYHLPDKEN